jgi:MFS family permease
LTETSLAASPKAPAQAWYIVAVLSGAMAFSLVDRFALSLLFEPIKTDLNLSDTRLGLLHGVAFGIFYAGLGIPIAWLVDMKSRKWVAFWGVAVWSLATAACGFASSFLALLSGRVGVGAGEAAIAPAGYSMIGDTVPAGRLGTAISIFQMGAVFGAGLAFVAGGTVYAAMQKWIPAPGSYLSSFAPWQLTFMVLALPGLLFMALILTIKEPARRKPADARLPQGGLLRYLKDERRLFVPLFLGNAFTVAINYAIISWVPAVLARNYGWSVGDIGQRIGLVMLTAAPAGVILGGVLADRWSSRFGLDAFARVLLLSPLLSLPFLAATFAATSGPQLYGLVFCIQFATGLAVGVGPAVIQPLARSDLRGRVSAVYVLAVNLIGLGIGPVAIGALSDTVFTGPGGLSLALSTYILSMGILSVGALLLFRQRLAARGK